MKNKLVPLLGIAFVVAVVATGIFYGLFVSKMRNAPNPQDSHALGAIARQQRRSNGKYTLLAPAPTPRPKKVAAH